MSSHAQSQKDSPPETERWQTIFDGKTLNGWKPSAPGFFTVEDGAITGRASREQTQSPVFIVWEGGKVKDFRLRFRCRVDDFMDHAEIHFRAQVNGKELTDGYQADFSGFLEGIKGRGPGEKYPFGGLAGGGESNLLKINGENVATHFAEKSDLHLGNRILSWVDYEIKAIGNHIILEIDGKKYSELIDQRAENRPQPGVIAIALHAFGNMRFQIKDIELKVLRSQSEDSETTLANYRIATIETILKELSSGSAEKALELLKQNLSLVNSQNGSKQTPLHVAASNGHKEVVAWLVANGAELNPVAYNGFTPLHLVKTADVVRILIKAGGSLDALDYDQKTPLRHAANDKNLEVIKVILESGYKMDLISAIYLGDSELVAKLILEDPKSVNRLANGTEGRKENSFGNWSPLMIAVWQKDKKIVQMLLDAGADVNDKTSLRFSSGPPRCMTITALTNALTFKNTEMLELLLRHGASKDIDCGGGETLMQHLKDRYAAYPPEIIALLEKEWPKKN
ncbi:MAG: ankyrin repeat domain-containing protein [Acidobacteriota bacterium]|nr:ankyrin repeat domain-containing protein [Acidobacteriota bacterium]